MIGLRNGRAGGGGGHFICASGPVLSFGWPSYLNLAP